MAVYCSSIFIKMSVLAKITPTSRIFCEFLKSFSFYINVFKFINPFMTNRYSHARSNISVDNFRSLLIGSIRKVNVSQKIVTGCKERMAANFSEKNRMLKSKQEVDFWFLQSKHAKCQESYVTIAWSYFF